MNISMKVLFLAMIKLFHKSWKVINKLALIGNHLSSKGLTPYSGLRWRSMWVFRWCLCAQRNSQKSHLNGFSPVCILMWRRTSHVDRNTFPQIVHVLSIDQAPSFNLKWSGSSSTEKIRRRILSYQGLNGQLS